MRVVLSALRRPAVLLALFAAGCTTTGYLGGRLSGPGVLRTPIEFEWIEGWWGWSGWSLSGDRGRIKTTLPSGETFSGRFIQVTQTRAADELRPIVLMPGFDGSWPEWGPAGGDAWVTDLDIERFRAQYADSIVATLRGDKGHAMRCRFRLFDPRAGFRGGGSGECQVSSGNETVAVQF